jgi:hypothetical protein
VSEESRVTVTLSLARFGAAVALVLAAVLTLEARGGATTEGVDRARTIAKAPTASTPVDAKTAALRPVTPWRAVRRAIAARTAHSRSGAQAGSISSANAVHF